MPKPVDHGRAKRAIGGRSSHLVIDSPRTVRLRCGHVVTAYPIATKANGKRLYACPDGCPGLQLGT